MSAVPSVERLDGVLVAGAGPVGAPKRRLAERDPERHRADVERLRRLDADPAFQREVLLMPERLRSRPYRFAA